MTWRLARGLERLRQQINAAYPNRSKTSDGTIGDAAHASRSSDHNPWVKDGGIGVVTALDITHDPAAGVDIQKIADALVASKDSRIKYIICNGRIVSGSGQKQPAWTWRNYTGANKHTRHIHISVKSAKAAYDDMRDWQIRGGAAAQPPVKPSQSVLKRGSKGPFVTELQQNLVALGYPVKVDAVFGAATEAAVKAFQQAHGLAVDGWAGPRTLDAIGRAVAEKAAKPKIEAAEATVPETAEEKVRDETSLWSKITGVLSGSAGLGTLLYGVDWKLVAAIIIGGIVVVGLIYLFRRRLVSAYREINAGLAK